MITCVKSIRIMYMCPPLRSAATCSHICGLLSSLSLKNGDFDKPRDASFLKWREKVEHFPNVFTKNRKAMSPERRFPRAEKIHLKGEWKGESLLLIAHGKQTQSSGAFHDALAKVSRESSQKNLFSSRKFWSSCRNCSSNYQFRWF